jgi:hypothetical protein
MKSNNLKYFIFKTDYTGYSNYIMPNGTELHDNIFPCFVVTNNLYVSETRVESVNIQRVGLDRIYLDYFNIDVFETKEEAEKFLKLRILK